MRNTKPAEITPATVPGHVVGYWVTWLDRMGQPRQKFVKGLQRALGLKNRLPLNSGGKVSPKVR